MAATELYVPAEQMNDFTHLSHLNARYKTRIVTVSNGAEFVALVMTLSEMRKAASVLYLHVHRDSRKCYVGITIMAAGARWTQGGAYRNNRRFGNAIKSHGWQTFDSYILAFAQDRDALNQAEVAAIVAAGGHKSRYTYNLSPGGDLVADNDKPIFGLNLNTGESRRFKSGVEASRQLGWDNVDRATEVARGEKTSTGGWWFRFEDDLTATAPTIWGEELRVASVRHRQGKPLVAIHLKTREERRFSTTKAAGDALGLNQSMVSMVASGRNLSAKGWWFKYEGDDRLMPLSYGQKVGRLKRDKAIYAVNLRNGEHREFRNCTVASKELGLAQSSVSTVASGKRVSAGGWWFSYDKNAPSPAEYGANLMSKYRSKAVIATNIVTGIETEFSSAANAAVALGVSRAMISLILSGKRKPTRGYAFRFV